MNLEMSFPDILAIDPVSQDTQQPLADGANLDVSLSDPSAIDLSTQKETQLKQVSFST